MLNKRILFLILLWGANLAFCQSDEIPVQSLPEGVQTGEDHLDLTKKATIPSSGDFGIFLERLLFILEQAKYGDLYDYFSPGNVRARMTKKEFLDAQADLFRPKLRGAYIEALKNIQSGTSITHRKISKAFRIYHVRLLDDSEFTIICALEKGFWVLEELTQLPLAHE